MKVLIVEDDKYKSTDLKNYLCNNYSEVKVSIFESLASGLFEIENNQSYDLVLLDMSMPSFDKTNEDPSGGTPESFAGDEFLAHMSLMQINVPVIIVTQYDNFGADENQKNLDALKEELRNNYNSIYVGTVYYQISTTGWHRSLKELIRTVFK
tara:strand:+ start:6292 stop:6750 length:459 start_codon:yes stop_codon:yes gene_type:complete